MAQNILEQAKAMLEEAERLLEEQAAAGAGDADARSLFESRMGEALVAAQEALVEFRRASDAEGRLSALEVVVQCGLALNDQFGPLMAASDELAMLKKTGDKAATSRAMDMLQSVQSARGDPQAALETAEEWLSLQRELGDLPGEAKALRVKASLKLDVGRHNEAAALAAESLKLYQQLGLQEGAAAAQRTVSRVCAARGVVDKAPNRQEALEALQGLAAAVEARDQRGWDAALKVLNETGAYSQADVDGVMKKALEKDPVGAQDFLDKQGIGSGQKKEHTKSASDAKFHIKEMNQTDLYVNFRAGGLQYGPRFRCLQGYGFESSKGRGAFAVLQVSEERTGRLSSPGIRGSWTGCSRRRSRSTEPAGRPGPAPPPPLLLRLLTLLATPMLLLSWFSTE
ncbi:unnamed protein product [Prorocentrum cordatum]|uniref:Uncharacterized protein n=1 Tax=Prorocentrum cordatum TaxID=2364126 RepID=A0ABN9PL09_9DINO|nr:unnamed protein product [Polarella glacialis]